MWANAMTLLFICWFNLSYGRPAEEPVRFSLNAVTARAENEVVSRLEQGKELVERAVDAIRIARGRLVNTVILIRNIIADRAEQLMTSETKDNLVTVNVKAKSLDQRSLTSVQSTTSVNLFPSMRREMARLENETSQAILEKTSLEGVREVFYNFLRPTPLVDGIKEEEKYGNTGDRFAGIGRAVVNGYENLSNFLNTLVNFPVNTAKLTSQKITEALNQVGARIVGLE